MSFTLTGTLRADKAKAKRTVTWDAGKLSGDPEAIKAVETMAQTLRGRPIGPPGGPHVDIGHLRNPLAALFLMTGRVFDPVPDASGDVPEAPEIPEGCIG